MLSRLLAPAFGKMSAIDLTDFVISIVCSEQAMNVAIRNLKNGSNGNNCEHRETRGLK
jgi:hypothetical protein